MYSRYFSKRMLDLSRIRAYKDDKKIEADGEMDKMGGATGRWFVRKNTKWADKPALSCKFS